MSKGGGFSLLKIHSVNVNDILKKYNYVIFVQFKDIVIIFILFIS